MTEYSYIKAPMAWNQNELSFIGIDPDKEFLKINLSYYGT
jgi:hypothetical protein